MFFGFNGTSAAIYGAKRGNHGQYNVTIDNFNTTSASGASDTEQFQQLLYTSGDLDSGFHNMTILNVDGNFLDVDYVSDCFPFQLNTFPNCLSNFQVTFKTNVGQDGEDIIINTFQNAHPSFSYTPASSWKTPSQVERFMGGSGQCVESIIRTKPHSDELTLSVQRQTLPQ